MAMPASKSPAAGSPPPIQRFVEALPSIEDFLEGSERLPSIHEFMATDSGVGAARAREMLSVPSYPKAGERMPVYRAPVPEVDEEGWAISAWQRYDWAGASALAFRASDEAAAAAEWSATDWGIGSALDAAKGSKPPVSRAGPTASEVATALDAIARRIRSGELQVDKFRGSPPEAAIAAALAALLKLRG
ncbi:MAG: hypothetical protein H0T48_06135 [Gemmatimonadaceae bacterium]|nr:hypothetical protein [Gemmatimonadaceae bacterium]